MAEFEYPFYRPEDDVKKLVGEIKTRVYVIQDRSKDFALYKNTIFRNEGRPAVFWPDGRSIGYGYAAHVSGHAQYFYSKFKYWGFDGPYDFYLLPMKRRNDFLEFGSRAWSEVFGSNREVELFWQRVEAEISLHEGVEGDRVQKRARIARIRDELEVKEGKLHSKLAEVARMYKAENEARLAYKIRRAFRTIRYKKLRKRPQR